MRVATLLTILTTSLFLSLSQTRILITLNVVHIIMISIQIFSQSHRLLGTKLLSHRHYNVILENSDITTRP
jgi:hypothetical protein